MKLNNSVYNVLKWVALIFLPALAALYSSLSGIWGLPYAVQIVGTIASIEVFLGAILGISTYKYNKNK